MIKNNFIDGARFGGIVMDEKSSAEVLSIENNQVRNIAALANDDRATVVGVRLVDAKNGEVVNNLVGAVGLQAPNARCLGIQLLASNSVRLAGNDVGDIGPAEGGAQTSAGIEVIGTFDQLDVVNNHVRRSRNVSQVVDNADWYAVLINGARAQPPRLRGLNTFFAARTNTAFLLSANRILAQLLGREWVSLQGNFLEAYGVGATVRAAVGGACTFNDNRCTLRGREQPAVDLAAGAAVVNANQVQGTLGKVAVLLKLPDAAPFTVLGNITHNGIQVNDAFLAAPWAPLNVLAP